MKTSSLCCLGIQPRGLFRENLKSVLTKDTASWPIPDLAILHGCTTITANFISNAKILPQIPDANFGTIKYIYSVYQCMRMYSICYPPYNVLYTVRKKILEKWTINVYWWVGVKDTDSIIYVSITVCRNVPPPHEWLFMEKSIFADFFLSVYSIFWYGFVDCISSVGIGMCVAYW